VRPELPTGTVTFLFTDVGPGLGLLNTFAMSRLFAVAAGVLVCPTLLGAQPVSAARAGTVAYEASAVVASVRTFPLPRPATNVAVHWFGQPTAHVRVAFSPDGVRFGKPRLVLLDELGEGRRTAETYGAVMSARGARAVRVWSDRPLRRLTILALTDRGPPARPPFRMLAATEQPAAISRAGWGADESLRFDSTGKEIWSSAFYPVQKVIVHHTATQNGDPNPTATIRSIYYYHAVTQGWGDIGYNFLIDEAGRVYEGRYSRQYAPGESPTGQDLNGNGVTAAHAQGYNSGTVGIALLGTLTNQDATPAARGALERLIAWIDSSHGIDPQGSALYTNPVSGLQATFPNIAGHRDVAATECPGGSFYATLPTIRSDVANLITASAPDFSVSASPSSASTTPGGSVSYSVAVGSANGFTGSVGLAITGLPVGATASFVPATVTAPGSSQLTVATDASAICRKNSAASDPACSFCCPGGRGLDPLPSREGIASRVPAAGPVQKPLLARLRWGSSCATSPHTRRPRSALTVTGGCRPRGLKACSWPLTTEVARLATFQSASPRQTTARGHKTYSEVALAFPDARREELALKGKSSPVPGYWIPP
jgi:hypothetical protein